LASLENIKKIFENNKNYKPSLTLSPLCPYSRIAHVFLMENGLVPKINRLEILAPTFGTKSFNNKDFPLLEEQSGSIAGL
jgi:hypothetical protein